MPTTCCILQWVVCSLSQCNSNGTEINALVPQKELGLAGWYFFCCFVGFGSFSGGSVRFVWKSVSKHIFNIKARSKAS